MTGAQGFNTERGLLPRKAQTTLRTKRPEKRPGGFRSRAPCNRLLRSRRENSFPSVRFGGRFESDEQMHDNRGTVQEYRNGGDGR